MTSFLLEGSSGGNPVLDMRSLEEILRAVEPGVVLYPTWLMHNIVTIDQGVGRSPFAVHDSPIHVIGRARLTKIAESKWLALPGELPPVDTLILLERPESEWLNSRPPGEVLRYYWRLLFHNRVAAEMRRKLPAPPANNAEVETRIERIGRRAFNEAKYVLQREHYLPPSAGDAGTYAQFTALFLELHCFRPDLLPIYFPAISDGAAVLAALTSDVAFADVLRQTRPAGAADAHPQVPPVSDAPVALAPGTPPASAASSASLLAEAQRAAGIGNTVRAAILRQRNTPLAPGEVISPAAGKDLDVLIERLSAALHLSPQAAGEWRSALIPVLVLAGDGWWNQEARLLYDLQKACVNYEREIYSVGVIEWLLEFGRRRLRRPQTNQRLALICKSLCSAANRIVRVRLTVAQREELGHLVHDALHRAEECLCDTVRPVIEESLKAGELVPRNAAERVAENKVVEELLDGLTHRGFITLGSVRDAIANNQLKFKDIPNPVTFLSGDPLFRIDRRLSESLDGIYHRGEIYLRLFQRGSSVLFATSIGRLITRTILMPLLGAYVIIAGLDHTLLLLGRVLAEKLMDWEWPRLEPFLNIIHMPHNERPASHGEIVVGNVVFACLAVLLLGVVNWAAFRRVVGRTLVGLGRALGFVFYKAPKWVVDRPAVQAVLNSRMTRFVLRYIVKPSIFAALAWIFVRRHTSVRTQEIVAGVVFVAMNFLLNNPVGRAIEQAVFHWLRAMAARVTHDILGNLFAGILHFFARRMEDFDRMIYAVDEWLRFRDGQPRSSLYAKAVLGIGWFYIAYVSRFAVNLLVEPQINPIKHVPWVTVGHKLVLSQAHLVASTLPARAKVLALPICFAIPGIFGFLAWELRSNWMLYRSNRSKFLKPVMVGSHGESMARLLRPGFHSGTVPKTFAQLRKAYHLSEHRGDPTIAKTARLKYDHAIEHIAHAIAHFIERETLALLNEHPAWRETPIALNGVKLYVTRITIDLACPALAPEPMQLFFEQRGGWILAGTEHTGWASKISQSQAQLLGDALLGLYKIAGVDVVQEQVENFFAPQPVVFELSPDEMTVWLDRQFVNPLVFTLNDKAAPQPRQIDAEKLLFRPIAIEWEKWVGVWESPAGGAIVPTVTLPTQFVLPLKVVSAAV